MSVINTNVKALVAQESMRSSNISLSQAMERLSTGSKINSAKDDAAGLAITNRMTSQIRGMAKAINNVNDAISMSQTAEGALGNVGDILQRMRELAVQAATGTVNDTDRGSINLEVTQLKAQIDDIAAKTNHNNIKLLDGTAQGVVIQTGTNSGDTLKIGFASTKTKDIGIGSKAFLQSTNGTFVAATTAVTAKFAAFSASSLYLNGVAVGASIKADDNASNTEAEASAIAKAAAINRVANLSGVYARAENNQVSGSEMTVGTAVATGTLTINGVVTDEISTSLDNSLSRKTVVAAINAKTSITGVVATDTQDDNLGVVLTAADGRNIDIIASTALTAALTGLNTSLKATSTTTFVGSYSLYTLDGRDISVSAKTGSTNIESSSGLQTGTYKADTAMFTTVDRVSQDAVADDDTTGLLKANSMVINGVQIGAALTTDDTASYDGAAGIATSSVRAASAIAIAAAINRSSDKTGVKATAGPNIVRATSDTAFTAVTTTSEVLFLNGESITVNTTTITGVIDSINSYSGQTGVVASQWGEGLQLVAADGRNIVLGSGGTAENFGLGGLTIGTSPDGTAAVTFLGTVQLESDNAFTVKSGSHGVDNLELLGFREGTFGASENGLKINQVDVSTVSGATQAITAIDAAINTVSAAQANSGAINNRLDAIINNLTEGSKNMQASRSRILDTDYATETTNLAKQQIIQQAATAMLAQANQSSQSILSLLK
jgi:flagellin